MAPALDEILTAFSIMHTTPVYSVYDSSGVLVQKILHGAPADVFISANQGWMDTLHAEGQILGNTTVIAHNRLSLAVPSGTSCPVGSLERLTDFSRLAIADTSTAPAGIYAHQALERAGVYESLRPQILEARSARGAVAYLERREADAALIFLSDAISSAAVTNCHLIDLSLHDPILYLAAVLVDASDTAREVHEFLGSAEAHQILLKHGFTGLPNTDDK